MHSSVYSHKINVRIVNGQRLKFNMVNDQSPKNQHGQQSNAEKSWSKF